MSDKTVAEKLKEELFLKKQIVFKKIAVSYIYIILSARPRARARARGALIRTCF